MNTQQTIINELKKLNVTVLSIKGAKTGYLLTVKQSSHKVTSLPNGFKQGLTISQTNDYITFYVSVGTETVDRLKKESGAKVKRNDKILFVRSQIDRLHRGEIDGFTIDYRLNTPVTGFLVGGYSKVYVNPTYKEIETLLVDSFYTGYFIGGWMDKKDGKIYIELAKRFFNREKAIEAAKELNQIAVCNIETHIGIRI